MKSVLIADDDLSVLALMARALPEYRITTARNGYEALTLASQLADCDLLITDYLMPTMTGDELAGRLRAARPTLKTLLVTSHTAFVDTNACGTDAHLAKPFRCAELRDAVASLIGGSSHGLVL
jgi:CheY-like chemotaxis protein